MYQILISHFLNQFFVDNLADLKMNQPYRLLRFL